MYKRISVAGDFIGDKFIIGKYDAASCKFVPTRTEFRRGGAGNTYANVAAIISKEPDIICSTFADAGPTLTRYVDETGLLLQTWNRPTEELQSRPISGLTTLNYAPDIIGPSRADYETLIVSEYNKGALNANPNSPITVPKGLFDLVVIDSKYRSVDRRVIDLGKTSILRCTGDELDKLYMLTYDWVVHTNHDGSIYIYNIKDFHNGTEPLKLGIPSIETIDTVGAGDTFTAALGAYLTKAGEVSWGTIAAAVVFATRAAQDVCKKRFTAVTDVVLE